MVDWRGLSQLERDALRFAVEQAKRVTLSRQRQELREMLLGALHEKQRSFVESKSPLAVACCSGRAGKSYGLGTLFTVAAQDEPGGLSLYLAESTGKARELIWDGAIAELTTKHGLGARLWNPQGLLYVLWPNGHRTWLGGASNALDVEKYRGPAYRGVVAIDEAQTPSMLPFLDKLVYEVLQPRCADHRAPIRLTGTPGTVPAGLFYRASTGLSPGWELFHWALSDNCHFPRWAGEPNWREQAEEYLESVLKQHNWTRKTPAFQREYLGQWAEDTTNLVFPYSPGVNSWDGTFDSELQYQTVLGIDLATSGYTAFSVARVVIGYPHTYICHVEVHHDITLQRICAIAERLRRDWTAYRVVVDAGGLGRGFVEEMQGRYQLPAEPAEKQNKVGFAYMMAGELTSGMVRVHAPACRPLLDEWAGLPWNEERTGWSELRADHASDATLYAWRALRPVNRPEQEPPKAGTPEWFKQEAEKRRQAAFEAVRARQKARKR